MTMLRCLWITVAAALAASGCVYEECAVQDARAHRGQAYVVADSQPPPLRASAEVRPAKPDPNAAWVPGHWDWRGRWVWVDGRWDTPRPGYVWTPPVARPAPSGGVHYHPGHWRPRDSQPPPVYQQPGDVRVSVRPARPARPAEPAGHVRVETPDARGPGQRGQGGVVVRPGGNAQRPDVQTRRPPQVQQPDNGVQGGGAVRAGGGVRVEPGSVRPGSTEPTRPRTVRPAPGARTRPGTVVATTPGAAQGGQTGTVALTCRVAMHRAPAGGYVTINGRGWGSSPVVRVGGSIAAVVQTEDQRIRFEVPNDSSGGMVEVTDGQRTSNCGRLSIIRR